MATIMRTRTVWNGVAGAPYYSNLYFTDDGTLATAQDALVATNFFFSALTGNIQQDCDYIIEGNVARIDDVTGALVGAWGGTQGAGGGTYVGDTLPRQVQALCQWNTGVVVNGRFLRGRTFIPCIGEPINSPGGVPSAAFVASITTAAATLIADAGNELRVWSRTHGVSHPVVSGQGMPYWGDPQQPARLRTQSFHRFAQERAGGSATPRRCASRRISAAARSSTASACHSGSSKPGSGSTTDAARRVSIVPSSSCAETLTEIHQPSTPSLAARYT